MTLLPFPSTSPLPCAPGLVIRGDDAAGAEFSPCERYRYRLWRSWQPSAPVMLWTMLNPSTATELVLDPTITRCVKRARAAGCGGVVILNAFALRSTDPAGLYAVDDPIGPDNDTAIAHAAGDPRVAHVVAGWGAEPIARGRQARVLELLRARHDVMALRVVGGEHAAPGHPLYCAHAVVPSLWWPRETGTIRGLGE